MALKLNLAEKIFGTDCYRNPFCNGRFANMKCFCGSSEKLKNCHGREYMLTKREHKEAMKLFKAWEDSAEGQKFYFNLQRQL